MFAHSNIYTHTHISILTNIQTYSQNRTSNYRSSKRLLTSAVRVSHKLTFVLHAHRAFFFFFFIFFSYMKFVWLSEFDRCILPLFFQKIPPPALTQARTQMLVLFRNRTRIELKVFNNNNNKRKRKKNEHINIMFTAYGRFDFMVCVCIFGFKIRIRAIMLYG